MPHGHPHINIKRTPFGYLDRALARTSCNHRSLIVARPACRGCPSILPLHIMASRMNAARPPARQTDQT
jgi:hypothetical protein